MTKEETKNYVEEMYDYHCSEFGITREEAEGVILPNLIYHYELGLIGREDLGKCAEYLGYDLDLDEVDKEIALRKERREKRRLQRQRRREKLSKEKKGLK